MDIKFVNIMTGEILSSIKVTTSFIGQFFSSSRRERYVVKGVGGGYCYISQLEGQSHKSSRKYGATSK